MNLDQLPRTELHTERLKCPVGNENNADSKTRHVGTGNVSPGPRRLASSSARCGVATSPRILNLVSSAAIQMGLAVDFRTLHNMIAAVSSAKAHTCNGVVTWRA